MTSTKRNVGIDFIAGLLLLQIIYNHCCALSGHIGLNFSWISFYMPWFFFKGGMFFKQSEYVTVLKTSWQRLMKPFILFSLTGLTVFMIVKLSTHDYKTISELLIFEGKTLIITMAFWGNLPLWFLPVLFVSRIVCNQIIMKKKAYIGGGILLVVTLLLHYFIKSLPIRIPYYFFTSFTGSLFFLLGHIFSSIQYKRTVFIIALTVYISFLYCGIPQVDMRTDDLLTGSYFLWCPFALSGCITLNNIVYRLPFDFFSNRINLVSLVGKDSMLYYVSHWPILLALTFFCKSFLQISDDLCFYTSLVSTLILIVILKKLIKKTIV